MRRQNQRTSRADSQAFVNRHATCDQRIGFLDEGIERQDDAVTNQAAHAVPQDAGGNQVQNGLFTVDDERMARIVAALKTHDRSRAIRQQVDNLALALVTPLRADDNYVLTHEIPALP